MSSLAAAPPTARLTPRPLRRAPASRRAAAPRAEAENSAAPPPPESPQSPERRGGGAVAGGAAAFGAALYLLSRMGAPSFASLEAEAVPFATAAGNGRPSVLEFYADWCEVCRESVSVVQQVERAQAGRVNFVLLNVDNVKEMEDYDVDGIPHLVFLDGAGVKRGEVVGKFPQAVLAANAEALADGRPLPYPGRTVSETVSLASDGPRRGVVDSASPRAHGW